MQLIFEKQHHCLCVCWALLAASVASGVERYTIARLADVVIVGRLEATKATLQRDGWHFRARVAVKEVVYGPIDPRKTLSYEFVCSCCTRLPRPPLETVSRTEGLWFLKRSRTGVWGSAAASPCSDPGYRPIEYLDDMRKFLRTHRQGGLPEKAP